MKKAIVGLVTFAILAAVVLVFVLSRPTTKVTATAATPDQTNAQIRIKPAPEPGTVAFWNSIDAVGQNQWMEAQHELMGTVVGDVAETGEKWLSSVAPDVVYVEGAKCVGNLRRSETQVCEVRLAKKIEKMFYKCGNSRPTDVRACVMSMDTEVANEQKDE